MTSRHQKWRQNRPTDIMHENCLTWAFPSPSRVHGNPCQVCKKLFSMPVFTDMKNKTCSWQAQSISDFFSLCIYACCAYWVLCSSWMMSSMMSLRTPIFRGMCPGKTQISQLIWSSRADSFKWTRHPLNWNYFSTGMNRVQLIRTHRTHRF